MHRNMSKLIWLMLVFVGKSSSFPAGDGSTQPPVDGTVLQDPNPKVAQIRDSQTLINLVPTRPFGRDQGILEVPDLKQKADSFYDYAQHFVSNIFKAKPIVDSISEKEKYGNTGDQFRPIGKAIVNGYEGFSNFVNSAIDVPVESVKQITRAATLYLSNIGAKIVGL